ncbi:putative phosphinothricin acetyltransferase YwnH [Planktothrix serta PCC 8927]|uniref:Phosphinothricin acetyltransferase YwnH n=2 Tax=Planktothrix TaxID=54304 RepID=A0A7Z9BN53_9CYAN|nr:putative phosphinothricin acetyltransferase YwnH [Planktothrix serta PCC 8927]
MSQTVVRMSMQIRDAVETDLPTIVDIYNAAVPGRMATADLEPISVESRISWYQEHQDQTRPVWVIELDQQIVGWLSFQIFYNRPAYNSTAELSVYIHPDYQGQGIGKKLLTEALRRSPQLGLKALVALIFAHNQPSLKLFESFDFEHWGYLPRVADLDGIERDLVIMGRHLIPSKISKSET